MPLVSDFAGRLLSLDAVGCKVQGSAKEVCNQRTVSWDFLSFYLGFWRELELYDSKSWRHAFGICMRYNGRV